MNATISPLTYADFTIELIEFLRIQYSVDAICDGDCNGIVWDTQ